MSKSELMQAMRNTLAILGVVRMLDLPSNLRPTEAYKCWSQIHAEAFDRFDSGVEILDNDFIVEYWKATRRLLMAAWVKEHDPETVRGEIELIIAAK